VLQAWGATRATTVTYLIPVVGVTVGVVFLGEDLTWRLFVGGLLIIVGVATVNLRPWHRLQLQARRGATD
jgi:drug/metabolite transporter (DMT)-like permease